MNLTSPSSLRKQLMITAIGIVMVSMIVMFGLVWFVGQSHMLPVEISVSSEANGEYIVMHDLEGSIQLAEDEMYWQLLRLGLIVLAMMFVVAVVAAWLLNRRMFDRIASITTTAQTMDEHHLDARFQTTPNNDEIDHMSTAINEALDRLQSGFERQRLFVRAASHELHTPLTVARTALEIPLAEGRIDDELRPDIDEALAAQTRLEHLLDTLLTLSRGDEVGLAGEEVFLDDVVRRTISNCDPATTLHWHTSLDRAVISAPPRVVESIVENLVTNAVVHNVAHGWVEVALTQSDTDVLLSIENSGARIDADAFVELRRPFTRRPDSPGSGLGLAVVDQLVNWLGGDLKITARESGGLRTEVRFTAYP